MTYTKRHFPVFYVENATFEDFPMEWEDQGNKYEMNVDEDMEVYIIVNNDRVYYPADKEIQDIIQNNKNK